MVHFSRSKSFWISHTVLGFNLRHYPTLHLPSIKASNYRGFLWPVLATLTMARARVVPFSANCLQGLHQIRQAVRILPRSTDLRPTSYAIGSVSFTVLASAAHQHLRYSTLCMRPLASTANWVSVFAHERAVLVADSPACLYRS